VCVCVCVRLYVYVCMCVMYVYVCYVCVCMMYDVLIDDGCTMQAFMYVMKAGGIETDADYPYTGADGQCNFNSADVAAKISGYCYVRVCMYFCMGVCMCVCVCACVYVYECVCVCVC